MTKTGVFTVEAGTVQLGFAHRIESVWAFFDADFLAGHIGNPYLN